MATPIGTNEINSISRRYIMPTLVDNIYQSNVMFFRLNARNKKILQGGLQIEVPLVFQQFINGGAYQGFDILDVSPNDTVKNGAWDWKQAYVPVTVDGLSLIRADSPEAIVNFLSFYFENAQTELADILGKGVWSLGTNTKQIDGIDIAVDDGSHSFVAPNFNGTNGATYGGLARSTNTWWKSTYFDLNTQFTTTTITLAAMQGCFGTATMGARHPTLIVTDQTRYNSYWGLPVANQAFPVQPSAADEILAQAGFTNLLFNNVPLVVDPHIPGNNVARTGANTAGAMYFLNEDYIYLYVNPRADFSMKDFREPINQDAMTSLILWAGNLVLTNCARQLKLAGIT
jgi:hypothetical protein